MVQFMDATMWMDHPRTAAMREFLSDVERFGQLKTIHSNFSFIGGPDFLTNNIRVNPDLDSLGALGDIGWYCIRSILWAANFQLPKTALALRQPVLNETGVILSCGSSLYWEDGKITTFHCSFLTNLKLKKKKKRKKKKTQHSEDQTQHIGITEVTSTRHWAASSSG
ncbi:hypothetical protein CsSME_00015512 [Camellia sinensis var. sinensis]